VAEGLSQKPLYMPLNAKKYPTLWQNMPKIDGTFVAF
jgi:hypothetical protein